MGFPSKVTSPSTTAPFSYVEQPTPKKSQPSDKKQTPTRPNRNFVMKILHTLVMNAFKLSVSLPKARRT
jgi:hypothetical protein